MIVVLDQIPFAVLPGNTEFEDIVYGLDVERLFYFSVGREVEVQEDNDG